MNIDNIYQRVRAQTAASMAAAESAEGAPAGAAGTTESAPAACFDEEGVRRQAEAEWSGQPAVRTEFRHSGKAGYVALRVAEAKGIAKKTRANVHSVPTHKAGVHHRGNV